METATRTNRALPEADHELVVTRLFDAPRELVYRVWTDAEHFGQWWGPNGFTTTVQEMDLRPGGEWRLVMHGPDGRDYHNHLVFDEVVPPEKLVYRHEPEPGSEPVRAQVTVTFEEDDGKTWLTLRMAFASAAARDEVEGTYGAREGGRETLDRLGARLAGLTAPNYESLKKVLVLTRVLDAPREVVFRAWTDHDQFQRWWGPKGITNPRCEIEVRPGGVIRIDMQAPDGTIYPMAGVYREVVAPEKIVMLSGALGPEENLLFEVLHTLTFEAEGEKTRLKLVAQVVRVIDPIARQYLPGMEQGWIETLDCLEEELAEAAGAGETA